VPQVGVAAREPDVHLAVRIAIAAAQTEHARVVLVSRQDPVEERAQFQQLVELRTQATLVGLRGISPDLMRSLKRAGFGDWQLGAI